jgi:hypothetical protein
MKFGIGIIRTCLKNNIMKKYIYTPVLVMLLAALTSVRAQDYQEEYLGLPGDNLNLYAVMKLFQECETLEGFERQLNDENSRINNLDLNNDGYVDYVRVIDNQDRNIHYIVMQVAINARENQDVAVFTVIRETNGQVQIQLVGDEALYGRNYIIEPIYGETPNPGYAHNARVVNGQRVIVNHTTSVEIASWPLIRFIFLPTYVVWHSPWYYCYYPSYWHEWSPFSWHYYYGYHSNYYSYYYGHYRHWNDFRTPYYHSYYYNDRRAHSTHVSDNIHNGKYRSTYLHPEQREEGRAMYSRTHPDQRSQGSGHNPGVTSGRRTGSEATAPRQSTNTNTTRQSSTTGTQRQSTGTSTQRQPATTGTPRQSTGTSTQRQPSTSGTPRQSTDTNTQRQPAATGTPRQSTSTSTQRKPAATGTPRQSTSTTTERSKVTKSTQESGRR